MTTILLPALSAERMRAKLYPDANENESALGTNSQGFVRAGQRWELHCQLPLLTEDEQRLWSDLDRTDCSFRLPILQPYLDTGSPGSPRVAGGGQGGMTLAADGLTPAYEAKKAQWFSIVTGGQRYAYRTTAAFTATAGGLATIAHMPMLRVTPNDNDVIEIAQPYIEGRVMGFEGFEFEQSGVRGPRFTIRERV